MYIDGYTAYYTTYISDPHKSPHNLIHLRKHCRAPARPSPPPLHQHTMQAQCMQRCCAWDGGGHGFAWSVLCAARAEEPARSMAGWNWRELKNLQKKPTH